MLADVLVLMVMLNMGRFCGAFTHHTPCSKHRTGIVLLRLLRLMGCRDYRSLLRLESCRIRTVVLENSAFLR